MSMGLDCRSNSTVEKHFKFWEGTFNLMLNQKKLEKRCGEICPLFALFKEYMKEVASDGKVKILNRQSSEIKELRKKIRELGDGE